MSPVLPVVGGDTLFQPVYVDDVAQAAVNGILNTSKGIYELGGPEVASFASLMHKMLGVIQRRRWVMNVPFFAARIMAGVLDFASAITGWLFSNGLLTRDQVTSLRSDNVVGNTAKTLADLGVTATRMDNVIPEYLWPYRPTGQYAAIKNSAKNLKKS
jgi:NADH dehydrogenase